MEGFFASFQPFFSRFKAELILLSIALLIAFVSGTLYIIQTSTLQKTSPLPAPQSSQGHETQYVTVDVSGAVQKPGVYRFPVLSRFDDALRKAGGLKDESDKTYVERNFNLARILVDQEKIYIPYLVDISSGIVEENKRILDYTTPAIIVSRTTEQEKAKIDINIATIEELDTLTGIGKIQAEAIIKSRPYRNIEDLVSKNVLRQAVYTKIQNEIIAN